MNLRDLENNWINQFQQPLIIAGPCSAESEQQMLETAKRIKETNAQVPIFRAGIWKPRTKPNGFEGVGVIGLNWLKKVKEEYGFKTATEVANAHHVDAALKADIDILWIGARSTVNPFTVQEIAEALKGTEKIVLVKNPVNPDLALWIGALERLLGQDIKNLGVIHRGFSTYQKTKYRNNPNWQIALDFKSQFPNIPMLIDPSHICGNRTGLADITQEALNVGYQGAIIESHCNPDEAWSDAAQQVTPKVLKQIFIDLKMRKETDENAEWNKEMALQRAYIDELDTKLIEILGKRMKLAEKIGQLKKEKNVAILQNQRWNEILNKMTSEGKEIGLSPEFIMQLFKAIHQESIIHQEKVMNK